MFLRVGELIIYNNIQALLKIYDDGVTRGQNLRLKGKLKVKYIFRQIRVGTSVILFFRVILTRKYIPYIIFMIQGHLQCQKVNLKVK